MFAALLVAASTLCAVPNYQKIPQFYTSTDCTGPIDAESKLWSFAAKYGGLVMPFAVEGDYMQPWAYEKCLTSRGLYSIKIAVDTTACASNNAANQVVLEYYGSSSGCNGVPTKVPLTAGKCVRYARGSVRLTLKLNLADQCILTDWAAKMAAGGTEISMWPKGTNCKGAPLQVVPEPYTKECAQQPECAGCCPNLANCKPTATYKREKLACQRSGSTWRFATKMDMYSDNTCTHQAVSPFGDVVLEVGLCKSITLLGQTLEIEIGFTPPVTADVTCNFIEMTLRNNIESDFVPWNQVVNAGVAAVPHVAALVLAVVLVVVTL